MKNLRYFKMFFFFKLLPKLSDHINSDNCIGNNTSKSIRLIPVIIKKKITSNKDRDYLYPSSP